MDNNIKKSLAKTKEEADRRLLNLEIVIGLLACIILFFLIFVSEFANIELWLRIVLIIAGVIVFMIGVLYALRIEQVAGYYECAKCHHKYVPTYKSMLLAMHMGRTRRMNCPKCGQKSWQKKVLK